MTTAEEERDDRDRESSSRWGWVLWALAGLVVLAIGTGAYWWLTRPGPQSEQQPPAAPLVETATARAASQLLITQTAFLRPRAEVSVTAEAPGRIRMVSEDFRVGERVSEDELLVALETEDLQADVEQAEARVAQALASLADARVARERQERLAQQDFSSEAELEDTIVQVASAEADLANAEAGLTQAQNALADAEIRAPFDALVTAESAAVGSLVQPGTMLGTLIDAEAAELEMGLTPADLEILGTPERAIGGRVELRGAGADAMALGSGTVISVDPQIVQGTRTVALIVEVPRPFSADADENRRRPLRIDELVEAALPVAIQDRSVVQVPPEAVKGRNLVWIVENGRLRRAEPGLILREETRVLLDGDMLPEGSEVMVSDLPAAIEGQEVRVADERAEATESAAAAGQ